MSKFPCMLAQKFDAKRIKTWPVAVEPKLDGVRCLFVVRKVMDTWTVETLSRAGKPFTSLFAIEDMVRVLTFAANLDYDFVLDGEVRCGDSFKSTVSAVKRKSAQAEGAVFTVFDMIPTYIYFGAKMDSMPWQQRRAILVRFMSVGTWRAGSGEKAPLVHNIVLSKVRYADSEKWVMDLYAEYRAEGHEGAIVKTLDSLWSPRRSYAYMKLKAHASEDLTIIGAVEGEGRLVGTLGKLLVDRNSVTIGVGTGMSDDERAELWTSYKQGYLLGLTVEVGYHEVTPEGSLRHPVYMGLRIDK